MHGVRGPKWCPAGVVGTKSQTIFQTQFGGNSGTGMGPTGYKCKPARMLARALAAMARQYSNRAKTVKSGQNTVKERVMKVLKPGRVKV